MDGGDAAPSFADRLDAAQALYDGGRFGAALALLRTLSSSTSGGVAGGDATSLAVERLRCLAAFRAGELDEAATAACTVLAAGDRSQNHPARFDMLGISVVAAGELLRFDQSVGHLRDMVSLATRTGGGLHDHVRARGSAAACFALLGDPWAAQRLLSELIGLFQGLLGQPRLEATVRGNHASVCLQLARSARQGGDLAGEAEAIAHTEVSLERAAELATQLNDPKVRAFADVHAAEVALLQGDPARTLELLHGTVSAADSAGLGTHGRQLRLLRAEALLLQSDGNDEALACLAEVDAASGPGHQASVHVRLQGLLHRAHAARGDAGRALHHLERWRVLAQQRQYAQQLAQSRHLRTRLELEHLYRYKL